MCLFFITLGVHAQHLYDQGGLVRFDPSEKSIMLAFTASDMNDGTSQILRVLKRQRVKAAFFFTGRFFSKFPDDVRKVCQHGHYVGSHGNAHLLYCAWEKRDSTLVTRCEFQSDLRGSLMVMHSMGIDTLSARYFMPPYEYYNDSITAWAVQMQMKLVNYTPGSTTNADYTIPSMKNYRSSQDIYDSVMALEGRQGLNGYILLFHLGTSSARTNKFYHSHLERLIKALKRKGYRFRSTFQ